MWCGQASGKERQPARLAPPFGNRDAARAVGAAMTDPASSSSAPLWLVVNAASGSNTEQSRTELVERLEAAGHPAVRTISFPDEDLPDAGTLDAAGVRTLAIFTGDGTINSQVRKLGAWGGAVLVLPGGTQNLLAKTLHGEGCTVESVVAALGAGRLVRRDLRAVATSQGPALVEVLAGPGATWADVREGVRDLDLPTIASALGEAVRNTARGAPVRVVRPPLGKPEGYRALRIDAVQGVLTLDGYDAEGLGEVAAQGVAMLVKRDFRAGPHDELGTCEEVTAESDEPVALMIDGERFDGTTRETFSCITLPVQFLGPPDPAGG